MTKKRAIIILIIALLLIVAIVTGINAYFTSVKTVTNVFTIGNIQINLTEGDIWDAAVASGEAPENAQNIVPNQHIAKAPNVENIGANPAYVYLKVYVPVIGDEDLFTYTINPTDGQTGGWTKRANEEFHTTIDGQVYNIYTYDYDEVLEPGTTTEQALFDEVIFAEGMEFTPEQVTILGNVKNIIIKAYAIQTGEGISQETNEITDVMTGDSNEENGLVVSGTPVSNITVADYGQYINIGTNILGYGENNTEKADWKVFQKTNDGVWLILEDFLPNNKIPSGITLDTSDTHVANASSKQSLMTALRSDWSSLITGSSVSGETGVQVIGAVTLPMWLDSWNAKHGTSFSASGDEVAGYDFAQEFGNSETLYVPHTDRYGGAAGYWLGSISSNFDTIMSVIYSGRVDSNWCLSSYAVRPAVFLPASVLLNTKGDVWTVIP